MGKKERLRMGREFGRCLAHQGFTPSDILTNMSMLFRIIDKEDSPSP